uniref:tRNA dimethylallyltransferase n=1 Tax=candidate division WOR-3 bacterium TaxID=2052148 RepID=A0A7C6EFK6_UNCW3
MPLTLPVLVGPTGVGKTEIAVLLAQRYNLEIISADSRQVYKYMDIGTDKPSKELQQKVKFHMIDLVCPDKLYSAADYVRDVTKVIEELSAQGKKFILVGGSGLYLRALFQPFFKAPRPIPELRAELAKKPLTELYDRLKTVDPESAQKIHPRDRQRIIRALEIYLLTGKTKSEMVKESCPIIKYVPFYIGLFIPKKLLYAKIEQRFDKMIEQGLVQEVKGLLDMGYDEDLYAFNAIGYREIFGYVKSRISLELAIAVAKKKSKAYAKRQLTWFKREPGIIWIEYNDKEEVIKKIIESFPAIIEQPQDYTG